MGDAQAVDATTANEDRKVIDLGGLVPQTPWVQETQDGERFYSQSQFARQSEGRITLAEENEIPTNLGIMETFSVHPRSLLPSAEELVQFPVCTKAQLILHGFRIITYGEIMELRSQVGGGVLGVEPLRVRRHWKNRD